MAAASDIARLFAELALSLRRPNAGDGDGGDSGGEAAASAASSLAASLNPNPNPDASPRSRVLDAALSLMCFRAPEVYSCAIDSVVRTMISVLSSSVSCKVQRFEGGGNKKDEEILRVGSSISAADCEKLIGTCIDVLGNLEGHGLCHSLVQALLKAAVSASDYQSLFPMSCMYYEGCGIAGEIRNSAILKLQSLLPAENSVNNCEIPLRLLLWYLDPLLIKDTLSSILRETIHRPFLCLKSEFHERMAWRLLIVYLVTSPTMFTQTRALLHKWFLVTGLASVLELQIALVSSLLDVLSRPMWWGVSMELGLKLPFSHAYFSTCHSELLAVLTGPISCESFLSLVNLIGIPLAPAGNNINLTAYHLSPGIFHWNGAKVTRIDYNSTWAMLMNFPAWFYFATVLIFCGGKLEGKFLTNSRLGPVMAESRTEMELHHAAARYLAFILSPLDEDTFDLCFNLVNELSESWVMKSISNFTCQSLTLETDDKNAIGRIKKLSKPKASDTRFLGTVEGHEGAGTEIWLREFHKHYEKYKVVNGHSLTEGRIMEIVDGRSSLLFTRISLGILICCASCLDEGECALLLNYAATGEIIHNTQPQISKNEEPRKKKLGISGHESLTLSPSTGGHKWALRGATLVFSLFDCIEEICSSLCGSEEETIDFFCLLKGKVGNYLLKCIRGLLQPHIQLDEDGGRDVMLKDLSVRLVRWRQQGGEVFECGGAFNDILNDINMR